MENKMLHTLIVLFLLITFLLLCISRNFWLDKKENLTNFGRQYMCVSRPTKNAVIYHLAKLSWY